MTTPTLGPDVTARLEGLVEFILDLAGGDLDRRGEISEQHDELDAVVGGLNMLAEELELTIDDVRSRNVELERLNTELRNTYGQLAQAAKLASLGEIAAGIAHELNQPLGIIQLYCESAIGALGDSGTDASEAAIDAIRTAISQVARASDIIEHIRRYARDDDAAVMEPTPVSELVDGALLLLRRELRELDIEVIEDVEPGIAPLTCRSSSMQQVLFNLMANARDAIDGQADRRIEVRARVEGTQLVFEVVDNGPGVPADLENRIIDPFVTTKVASRGTGLGLGICHSIIADHGGTLTYRRVDGHTVFAVNLPHGEAE